MRVIWGYVVGFHVRDEALELMPIRAGSAQHLDERKVAGTFDCANQGLCARNGGFFVSLQFGKTREFVIFSHTHLRGAEMRAPMQEHQLMSFSSS